MYEQMGCDVLYVGKPHAPIYGACLDALEGLEPTEIVAVGDSVEHDVRGANGVGIDCCFVTGRHPPGGVPAGRLAGRAGAAGWPICASASVPVRNGWCRGWSGRLPPGQDGADVAGRDHGHADVALEGDPSDVRRQDEVGAAREGGGILTGQGLARGHVQGGGAKIAGALGRHAHPEGAAAVRHLRCDGAEADQSHGPAGHLQLLRRRQQLAADLAASDCERSGPGSWQGRRSGPLGGRPAWDRREH